MELLNLLEGVRVVEAASYLSGPFATVMLADLGADVVKVEPAPSGDPFRTFGKRAKGHGLLFVNTNRNKRAVTVDLRSEGGVVRLHELLDDADLFVTNWRPGVAEAVGLSADAIRDRHPRLVWIRISGFGQDGPLGDRAAFDPQVQARSGVARAQGGEGGPQLVRFYFADKVVAMFVVQAALAGLRQRDHGGRGAVIDLSMLDALAYFNFPDLLINHTVLSHEPRSGNLAGAVRPIATADGWVVLSPVKGRHIAAAFAAFGRPDQVERLKAIKDPAEMTRTMYDLLEELTRVRTSAECERLLVAHDVQCSPVLDFSEHLSDPQVEHNELYVTIEDPDLGPIRRVRYPALLDGKADTDPGRPFPRLKE